MAQISVTGSHGAPEPNLPHSKRRNLALGKPVSCPICHVPASIDSERLIFTCLSPNCRGRTYWVCNCEQYFYGLNKDRVFRTHIGNGNAGCTTKTEFEVACVGRQQCGTKQGKQAQGEQEEQEEPEAGLQEQKDPTKVHKYVPSAWATQSGSPISEAAVTDEEKAWYHLPHHIEDYLPNIFDGHNDYDTEDFFNKITFGSILSERWIDPVQHSVLLHDIYNDLSSGAGVSPSWEVRGTHVQLADLVSTFPPCSCHFLTT